MTFHPGLDAPQPRVVVHADLGVKQRDALHIDLHRLRGDVSRFAVAVDLRRAGLRRARRDDLAGDLQRETGPCRIGQHPHGRPALGEAHALYRITEHRLVEPHVFRLLRRHEIVQEPFGHRDPDVRIAVDRVDLQAELAPGGGGRRHQELAVGGQPLGVAGQPGHFITLDVGQQCGRTHRFGGPRPKRLAQLGNRRGRDEPQLRRRPAGLRQPQPRSLRNPVHRRIVGRQHSRGTMAQLVDAQITPPPGPLPRVANRRRDRVQTVQQRCGIPLLRDDAGGTRPIKLCHSPPNVHPAPQGQSGLPKLAGERLVVDALGQGQRLIDRAGRAAR